MPLRAGTVDLISTPGGAESRSARMPSHTQTLSWAFYAAKRNSRISSRTRRKAGSGARHIVRYVSRKGSQIFFHLFELAGESAPSGLAAIAIVHGVPVHDLGVGQIRRC